MGVGSNSLGDLQQLKVIATYSDGNQKDITTFSDNTLYSSSDEAVAPVTIGGLVSGAGTDTTLITASNGALSASIGVTVNIDPSVLSNLEIYPDEVSLTDSFIYQLTVTGFNGTPGDGKVEDITSASLGTIYSINDESITTISPDGLITTLKCNGSAIITATNGVFKEYCELEISIDDNEPPDALCKDIVVSIGSTGIVNITSDDTYDCSTDNYGISSISIFPDSFTCENFGENEVTLTVKDEGGNIAQCTATVTVIDIDQDGVCGSNDNCPNDYNPDHLDIDADGIGDICDPCDNRSITGSISPSQDTLWPPNHAMIPITIDTSELITHNSTTSYTISSVIITEYSKKGSGEGYGENIYSEDNFEPDFEITGDLSLNLRSEKTGSSQGRTYIITVTASDC